MKRKPAKSKRVSKAKSVKIVGRTSKVVRRNIGATCPQCGYCHVILKNLPNCPMCRICKGCNTRLRHCTCKEGE